MKPLLLPAALALGLLAQCHRAEPEPTSQLPAATQTGANTFGCLVNGQLWTPKGNDGTSNYSIYYDYAYAQGTLNVATYRATSNGNDYQSMTMYSDSLRSIGIYKLKTKGQQGAAFTNAATHCDYSPGYFGTSCKGTLTITRLDRTAGVVSGTFDFTLAKPGCDTVRVTDGRFDKKL